MSSLPLTKKERHLQSYIERKCKEYNFPAPNGKTLSKQRKNLARKIRLTTPEGQKKRQAYLARKAKRESK